MRKRKSTAGYGYRPYEGRRKKTWVKVLIALLLAAVIGFAALEGIVLGKGRTDMAAEPGILVIYGCQVRANGPSPTLQDRLDTALSYLEDHPDVTVVVSGGQGDDEHQSEADCMYDYLTAHGVDGDNILREDSSRNTWQNVNYTLDLLEREGYETENNVAAVSSGFHLARISMLWKRAGGGKLAGTLAAPVSDRPAAFRNFFREPLALAKSFLFDR